MFEWLKEQWVGCNNANSQERRKTELANSGTLPVPSSSQNLSSHLSLPINTKNEKCLQENKNQEIHVVDNSTTAEHTSEKLQKASEHNECTDKSCDVNTKIANVACKSKKESMETEEYQKIENKIASEHFASVQKVLQQDVIDLIALRKLCWHGCPDSLRYDVWMYLTNCWNCNTSQQTSMTLRKCAEYAQYVSTTYVQHCSKEYEHNQHSLVGSIDNNSNNNINTTTITKLQNEINENTESQANNTESMPQSKKLPKQLGESFEEREVHTSPTTTTKTFTTNTSATSQGSQDANILKQIRKDVPRMSGVSNLDVECHEVNVNDVCTCNYNTSYISKKCNHCETQKEQCSSSLSYILEHPRVQQSIERVLFIWSTRHPACGYVQGMCDLLLPFVLVILSKMFTTTCTCEELLATSSTRLEEMWQIHVVNEEEWINKFECSLYWCASYILEVMQDNYTHKQRGIFILLDKFAAVLRAVDYKLYNHLTTTLEITICQFAFRWFNCVLIRELNYKQVLRLFDTYLCDESRQWMEFHVYVCVSLLKRYSATLQEMHDFGTALCFLQKLPTQEMTMRDMDELLAEAYLLQQLYSHSIYVQNSHVRAMSEEK